MLALVSAPAANATWSAWGGFEPDTPQDVAQQRIFVDPDVDPVGLRVYFNGIVNDGNSLGAVRPNPNVGVLGTRVMPVPMMTASAILGVWKDCNGDGYVGAAESAVWEYRSEVLLAGDTGACPEGSTFNRDGWVTELIYIGNTTGQPNTNGEANEFPRVINDTESSVWADIGRPGVASDVHFDCPQSPFPRGTFDSTGGFLYWLDCQLGYNVAHAVNTAGVPGVGISRFEPHRDCASALNRETTPTGIFGQDECEGKPGHEGQTTGLLESEHHDSDPTRHAGYDQDNEIVTVFDCDAPSTVVTSPANEDPTGGDIREDGTLFGPDGTVLAIAAPSVGVHDPQGSLVDTLDNANRGWGSGALDHANCDAAYYEFGNTTDPRGPGAADDPVEDDFSATNPVEGKRLVDMPMSYSSYGNATQRTQCPSTALVNDAVSDALVLVEEETGLDVACAEIGPQAGVDPNAPGQLGLRPASTGRYTGGIVYLPPTYLGGTVRNDDLTPQGGYWFTFYARVGAASLGLGVTLPPGASDALYGAESCQGATSGVHNNWDCDATHWYNTAMGGTSKPTQGAAVPGDLYQLRDIDCYDGTLLGPVRASAADLSNEGPCPTL